jgi:hypothetical protein
MVVCISNGLMGRPNSEWRWGNQNFIPPFCHRDPLSSTRSPASSAAQLDATSGMSHCSNPHPVFVDFYNFLGEPISLKSVSLTKAAGKLSEKMADKVGWKGSRDRSSLPQNPNQTHGVHGTELTSFKQLGDHQSGAMPTPEVARRDGWETTAQHAAGSHCANTAADNTTGREAEAVFSSYEEDYADGPDALVNELTDQEPIGDGYSPQCVRRVVFVAFLLASPPRILHLCVPLSSAPTLAVAAVWRGASLMAGASLALNSHFYTVPKPSLPFCIFACARSTCYRLPTTFCRYEWLMLRNTPTYVFH